MFGPNVYILGGNHRFDVVGEFMVDLKKEKDWSDPDIVIENDVWIGANVTILAGVRISCGAIVGAGSVVTKDAAGYSISGGVPCRYIMSRFTEEEILDHEKLNK